MSTIPTKRTRKFVISDVKAAEDARTAHGLMTAGDLADFTAFDPTLDQAWLDAWEAELDAADGYITDETYRDEIQGKTQSVENAMSDARKAYRQLKYFVQKAFPDDKAVQSEFGFDEYDSARRSDIKLHQFMLTLFEVATKYNAQLIDPAVAYPAAATANLQTLATNLMTLNIDQELHKKGQTTTTQTRIDNLNTMWVRRQLIAQASKLVYADNYAKYQQYLLPASEANQDDFAIYGQVSDNNTNDIIPNATLEIGSLSISTTSDDLGNYGFADNIEPGTYDMDVSADGYISQTLSVTISSADETLIVNVKLDAV